MQRFCHRCAGLAGQLGVPPTSSLTGTTYQLKKFLKHTVPPSASAGLVSIFDSGSLYADYIVNTMASGSVEIDDEGRKNIVWYAGAQNGVVYVSGTRASVTDGVKVVLSDDHPHIHAFPTGVQELRVSTCDTCRGPVI